MKRQSGFTLIELMGAIAIIAVLVGLVTITSGVAIRHMRNVAAANNLAEVVKALELYKQKNGEYPPDGKAWSYDDPDTSTTIADDGTAAIKRHIKKRWPEVLTFGSNDTEIEQNIDAMVTIIQSSSALGFWLCGVYDESAFSSASDDVQAFIKEKTENFPSILDQSYTNQFISSSSGGKQLYRYYRAQKTANTGKSDYANITKEGDYPYEKDGKYPASDSFQLIYAGKDEKFGWDKDENDDLANFTGGKTIKEYKADEEE